MVLVIDGSIKVPEGMDEDKFNELWLQFVEDNKLEFTGVTCPLEEKVACEKDDDYYDSEEWKLFKA